MRLDKYLKVSRLIKRRTVANEACDAGRVQINGKTKVTLNIGKEDPKDKVIAKAKEALGDKLTGTIVKEIYVPGRIVNIVAK